MIEILERFDDDPVEILLDALVLGLLRAGPPSAPRHGRRRYELSSGALDAGLWPSLPRRYLRAFTRRWSAPWRPPAEARAWRDS